MPRAGAAGEVAGSEAGAVGRELTGRDAAGRVTADFAVGFDAAGWDAEGCDSAAVSAGVIQIPAKKRAGLISSPMRSHVR